MHQSGRNLVALLVAVAAFGSVSPFAQPEQAQVSPIHPDRGVLPAFEVSTIKPSTPDENEMKVMFTPNGIRIVDVPLMLIVREAFGLEDDHLFGGPGWAKTSRFDVEAKVAPEDAPKLKTMNLDQRRQMLVSLLEERCGLKYHQETRDLPEYELVVAKGGSKMQPSKPDVPRNQASEGHGNHILTMHGRGHLESMGTDVHGLVRILSTVLGRTVVDQTGLKGDFDYKLDWTPDDMGLAMTKNGDGAPAASASLPDDAQPSLFTALEEQLGLKLEATKGPVSVVVVDELEQPSAN